MTRGEALPGGGVQGEHELRLVVYSELNNGRFNGKAEIWQTRFRV